MLCSSCKKFLDVGNPFDTITAKSVYQSNTSSAAVLSGIYFDMGQIGNFAQGQSGISINCGLSSDELISFPTSILNLIYMNNAAGDGFWTPLYNVVYRANAAIEGITASTSLTSAARDQLLGEAKFLRAFCYFYLVNLYGDVPLLLTADYKVNAATSRSPVAKVYEQLIADLLEAKSLLNDNYMDANVANITEERIRPNKFAATALLARAYLYTSKWIAAAAQASIVIDNKALYDTVALNNVFLKNSPEAIWQLQPVYISVDFVNTVNTLDARIFVLENGPDESEHPVWVSSFLLQAFENGDQRKTNWIGIGVDPSTGITYNFPFKYKLNKPEDSPSEYLMMLRLAEQYLIRAEARVQQGDLAGARSDLDVIRHRAGLNSTAASTREPLLTAILQEREVELFTEWGHRWLDLKRTGQLNAVMTIVTPQKGGVWESFKQWYPLPLDNLRLNPNLTQNEGYVH
jgi:hypothetical protein